MCAPMTTFAATSVLPNRVITNNAEAELKSLPDDVRDAVDLDILQVFADPREAGYHLRGTHFCRWSRYTAGNRRVLYRIEGNPPQRIVILGIPHRNVAYPRTRH